MSKELHEILKDYDTDRSIAQGVRDDRIPDLRFARWSQLDDDMSEISTTEFQGEFNIISRERKNLQAEFRQNEVEVKFRSKEDNDELDKTVQGMYRTDRKASKSRQCFHIAQDDAGDCGFGAWRFVTEEMDGENALDTRLEIRREPIPEAIRRVFFDTNSKLYDKSDANHCSVISSFTKDGYSKWLKDNDLEESNTYSFDAPAYSIYETYYNCGMRYPLRYGEFLNVLEYYSIEDETVTYW